MKLNNGIWKEKKLKKIEKIRFILILFLLNKIYKFFHKNIFIYKFFS